MATAFVLDRSPKTRPYRVAVLEDGHPRQITGWCKGLAYTMKIKERMVQEEGFDDGGHVRETAETQSLFELPEDDTIRTDQGYDMREVASALQKELRRGNEIAAGHWAFELARSGFYKYVWRRILMVAAEDVGTGSPETIREIEALRSAYFWYLEQTKGRDKVNQFLGMAVLLICRAPKSREVDDFTWYVEVEVRGLEIPDYALDGHTKRGRQLGRGERYFYEESAKVHPEGKPSDYAFIHKKWIADQEKKTRCPKCGHWLYDGVECPTNRCEL